MCEFWESFLGFYHIYFWIQVLHSLPNVCVIFGSCLLFTFTKLVFGVLDSSFPQFSRVCVCSRDLFFFRFECSYIFNDVWKILVNRTVSSIRLVNNMAATSTTTANPGIFNSDSFVYFDYKQHANLWPGWVGNNTSNFFGIWMVI